MSKPFTLEIGWCVADNAKDVGELKVRKVAAGKFATLLYTEEHGQPLQGIRKADASGHEGGNDTDRGFSRDVHLLGAAGFAE